MAIRLFIIVIFLAKLSFGAELKTINTEEFLADNPSIERQEIINQITKQFTAKKDKNVTQAQLDFVWNNKEAKEILNMARFQIIDQKLYADSYLVHHLYFSNLFNYLKKLIKTHKINDVDFIVYARDIIPENNLEEEIFSVPAFMMFQNSDHKHEANTFIMPDSLFLNPYWGKLIAKIIQANINYPWNKKIEKIFWRGASTGIGEYNLDIIDQLPRLKIAILSKLYPNLIDARLVSQDVSHNSSGKELKKILAILFGKDSNKATETEHLQYKYLLSLDGNSATGTRVPWIMLSNSLLIKQDSRKVQWFYSALKPYVHYVPVNEDLTNIFSQLEWMKAHDNELQIIAKNAHNFVENNLMPEHIDSHMAIILNEYSKIQKDKKLIPTLPKAEDTISTSALFYELIRGIKIKLINLYHSWF